MFPSYLLQKVYLKGSLKNNEDGFEFALKNIVDTGTLVGMNPLVVDGESIPPPWYGLFPMETKYTETKSATQSGAASGPIPSILRSQERTFITWGSRNRNFAGHARNRPGKIQSHRYN
jgi:hypothetical protein